MWNLNLIIIIKFSAFLKIRIKDMANHSINLKETIKITESVSAMTESNYLIISNKEKCKLLIDKNDWSDENLIDFFISLHIVLEVGLNTFIRLVSLQEMQKKVDKFKLTSNLDNINFIDKVILFIYNSKFNFNGNINDADKYHAIIGKMRDFSAVRNKLLHGHSISTLYENGNSRQSNLRRLITPQNVSLQMDKFIFIMEGMRFYFSCLKSTYTESGKESLKNEYLNCDFLNKDKEL
jgi:hypothetical protein